MARSLFRLRNTSCFLMDMRSTMSLGSNRDCFTTWAMYPALPCWKSHMEASLGRGAPSSTRGGAQAGTIACWSPLLSPSLEDLVCMTLACLAGLNLLGGVAFSYFYHLFSLLLHLPLMVGRIKSERLVRWKGRKPGLGCLPRCVSPSLGLQ